MQNRVLARVLATMVAATAAVSTASVPMMIAPIVAMADAPTATITVKNVEAGATVKAYQLVKGAYDSAGKLTKYELTSLASGVNYDSHAVSVDDLVVYSAEEKTGTTQTDTTDKLAAWTAAVAKTVTSSTSADATLTSNGDSTYSTTAEPGLYLVLITKEGTTSTYNPILLAVNVSNADDVSNNITGSEVDLATAKFTNGTTSAYAKKTTNGLKKSIVVGGNSVDRDVVATGTDVSFKLEDMHLPSYSAQYESPKYEITDKLDSGSFDGITNLKVLIDGSEVSASANTYTLTEADGTTEFKSTSTSFKIVFASKYLTAENAGKSVVITYSAKLSKTATNNFAENANNAKLEYSYIDTDNKTATKTVYDNTWVYTFGIDADIDSEDTASNATDYTLNKVTATGGTYTAGTSDKALADAEFTLYTDAACTQVATYNEKTDTTNAVKSDSKGHISFTGLNEGTYYLKETNAPSGYTVNSTVYKITITPTFNTTDPGKLDNYTITTEWTENGTAKSSTTTVTASAATITESTGDIAYTVSATTTPVEIVNTTLQQLPFTGGEGRYAIYIGSVALAALVVILLIVKHRREEQEQ